METPRARLLQAAAELLQQICGEVPATLSVIVRHQGGEYVVVPLPGEVRPACQPDAPRTASDAGLPRLERDILAAATRRPTPAKRLAAQLSRPCNSYFRAAMRSLVRRGLLAHLPEGYRLA